MPALNWSALRESNSRRLVKSQVHNHYAKSGVDRLEGLKPPSHSIDTTFRTVG